MIAKLFLRSRGKMLLIKQLFTRYTLMLLVLFGFNLGVANSSEINVVDIQQQGIKYLNNPSANIFSSGQPSEQQLKNLSKLGVLHVINLRPKQEQQWDEGAYVEALGLQYYNLPVNGAHGITLSNAIQLAATLEKIGDEPVLVHCSSSNRVGALVALNAFHQGEGIERAIAKGKAWGLTRLEALTRAKFLALP
mgnify:FL=1